MTLDPFNLAEVYTYHWTASPEPRWVILLVLVGLAGGVIVLLASRRRNRHIVNEKRCRRCAAVFRTTSKLCARFGAGRDV